MKKQIIFVILLVFLIWLTGCSKDAASIGIIGGADGPTAVFVTSGSNWQNICGLLVVIVVAILVVFFIHRTKKKK